MRYSCARGDGPDCVQGSLLLIVHGLLLLIVHGLQLLVHTSSCTNNRAFVCQMNDSKEEMAQTELLVEASRVATEALQKATEVSMRVGTLEQQVDDDRGRVGVLASHAERLAKETEAGTRAIQANDAKLIALQCLQRCATRSSNSTHRLRCFV